MDTERKKNVLLKVNKADTSLSLHLHQESHGHGNLLIVIAATKSNNHNNNKIARLQNPKHLATQMFLLNQKVKLSQYGEENTSLQNRPIHLILKVDYPGW